MPYDPRQDPKYNKDKLLLALTHQESRFNPNAVSPTGARGLTQVLPSTARSPGFGIAPNPNALNDPEQNMAFGKSYLNAMQKRYNGDNAAALVAYNGGPGKADEWIKSGKNDKVLSKETSNYYKSVLSKAGEGFDFSKIKSAKLPSSVPSTDDEEEETEKTTGFSKLKKPGSNALVGKSGKDESTDETEEAGDEEEKSVAKVKKVKKSKEEDDEDDDEEDDDSTGSSGSKRTKGSKHGGGLDLTPFTPGAQFKPVAIQLGIPKLQLAPVETLDDPRDR